MIITIDGPVASGKTTIAQQVAQQLGLFYIYSGLLFRAVAYELTVIQHIDLEDAAALDSSILTRVHKNHSLHYEYTPESGPSIFYDNINLTKQLTSEQIGIFASSIATNPYIRASLCEWQRNLASMHNSNIIVDGRDGGTEIFPHAQVKLFITASIDERARRLQKRDQKVSFQQARTFIIHRDTQDSSRSIAPLKVAQGAYLVDTTHMSIQQAIKTVCAHVDAYRKERNFWLDIK